MTSMTTSLPPHFSGTKTVHPNPRDCMAMASTTATVHPRSDNSNHQSNQTMKRFVQNVAKGAVQLSLVAGIVAVLLRQIQSALEPQQQYPNRGNHSVLVAVVATLQKLWRNNEHYLDEWKHSFAEYARLWAQAAHTAVGDGSRAISSLSIFGWITVQPWLQLGFWMSRHALHGTRIVLYDWILVRGLFSPTAVQSMQTLWMRLVAWQLSLTPRQCLWEALIIVGSVAMLRFVAFLHRRQYLRRMQRSIRRSQQAVVQVRNTNGGVYCVLRDCAFTTFIVLYPKCRSSKS